MARPGSFPAGADFKERFQLEIDQKKAEQLNITRKFPNHPIGLIDLTFARQPSSAFFCIFQTVIYYFGNEIGARLVVERGDFGGRNRFSKNLE